MHRIPRRILIGFGLLLLLLTIMGLIAWELLSSALEARYLAKTAQNMTWRIEHGDSKRIRFPAEGPYDLRLGYSKLPAYTRRLLQSGWQVAEQARISIQMERAADLGLFLPYKEKDQAGILLLDSAGQPLYRTRYPALTYTRFEDIPKVLVDALLYIENRELLAEEFPTRNPAVEWDRLGQALVEKAVSLVDRNRNVPGGSTLPTQIEKYRHSPNGLTQSMGDKLRQMGTASLRAYLDGVQTLPGRRRTVMAYLNTVPLAAAPRFGEVHGVGDGLWAWYGLDFAEVNRILSRAPKEHDREYASALKHVLSLIVAERRPSYYLAANRKALDAYTDDHLNLLASAGIIPHELAQLAKEVELRSLKQRIDPPPPHFVDQKAANSQRIRVAALLGEPRLYDVDRLDLQAQTTLNQPAQKVVSAYLQSLAQAEAVAASGLIGHRLLKPDNDFSKIIYSFTLYEKSPAGMLLRVQADNLNQPFDINQQTKLDLGSTAKLRTLVTYLEIIAHLHADYARLEPESIRRMAIPPRDVLANWVAEYLLTAPDKSLAATLEAAMARRYSASPEIFFTGGGQHVFANFDPNDNGRIMDVWQATRNSVNLVYIRIMRDIVRHYASRTPGAAARILDDASNPIRQTYLMRFVDKEGRVFLNRFHQRHKGKTAVQMADDLYSRTRFNPRRFTSVFRYLEPRSSYQQYVLSLHQHIPESASLSAETLAAMYKTHAPEAYNLADRGYVSQIHPLELWLVGYLRTHPQANTHELFAVSSRERVEVYNWLFKTSRKNAQDIRIQSLLEVESFDILLNDWKRLGYPFDSITPSYATAIGSSGDRPAALAELMGILVNDGMRLPVVSLTEMRFAVGTPYETRFKRTAPTGERLLPPEVTRIVRRALGLVVESGTAARLAGVLKNDAGQPIAIGGKTGTGDHRYQRFGRGGQLLESRVVNRTATFVFYLGDRYFGTLTALVPGPQAAQYEFTSSLTAQMLKTLLPKLKPMLFPPAPAAAGAAEPAAAPETVAPTEPAEAARHEKAEGPTSQADPPVPENATPPGGFPDDLDPGVAVPAPAPAPLAPEAPPPAPAPAPVPAPAPPAEPNPAPRPAPAPTGPGGQASSPASSPQAPAPARPVTPYPYFPRLFVPSPYFVPRNVPSPYPPVPAAPRPQVPLPPAPAPAPAPVPAGPPGTGGAGL